MKLTDWAPHPHLMLVSTGLCCSLLVAGCAVKFISSYDEVTDKSVSSLQKKTAAHFVALEAVEGLPDCVYDKHKPFYAEAKVEVSALAVRTAAIPQNERTSEQVSLLASNVDSLEKLHKLACLSKDQIAVLKTQFNIGYTAILKLELAKQRPAQ